MGDPCNDEMFFYILWNVSLLTQDKGLKNARGWKLGLSLQKISNTIPPVLYLENEWIF
jgi:hypothetical protein